jgi:hypothetical protein
VVLKVNDAVLGSKEITLAGGTCQECAFTATGDSAGVYRVAVSGLSGEFTVRAAPTTTPTVTPSAPETPAPAAQTPLNWWLIGGIIAAVIVLGGIAVRFARRWR